MRDVLAELQALAAPLNDPDGTPLGCGIASAVLGEIESWARERGFATALLETGTLQPEAIAMYERCGYARIPKFPPYVDLPRSVCMRKAL